MPQYNQLDKNVNDVLRVGYVHNKLWQVSLNHKGPNPSFFAVGSVAPSSAFDATPTIKYNYKGLEVEGRVDSSSSSINTRYKMSNLCSDNKNQLCSLIDAMVKGLTVGSKCVRGHGCDKGGDQLFKGNVFADLVRGNVVMHGSVNPTDKTWDASCCFTVDKIGRSATLNVGGNLKGPLDDASKLSYSVGAAYSFAGPKPWVISLKTAPVNMQKVGKIIGGFYASNEQGHAIAAETQYMLETNATQMSFGGYVNLDPANATWVKARVTPKAEVAAVLSHRFSPNLVGSFGCQFDGSNRNQAEALSYGMKWNITL